MVERRVFSNLLMGKNMRYLQAEQTTRLARSAVLNVGFVLLEHFSLPAFTQALDTLVTANLLCAGLFTTQTFAQDALEVKSDLGIAIRPDHGLHECKLAGLDLLVVCGGLRTPLQASPALRQLLKKAAEQGVTLAGVWNGAWFLGEAGLLDGYSCVIHPENRPALVETMRCRQVTSESHVADRDRYTAASPSGALYMVLAWIRQVHGDLLVNAISDILAFENSRYRRASPTAQQRMTAPLREVVQLMETNLEEPLQLDQIASYVGLSRRHIERLFHSQLETTPQRYYLELRLTEGRRLLQYSSLPIVQVAVACGFVSPSHFSRCYTAYFSYSPSKEKRLEA